MNEALCPTWVEIDLNAVKNNTRYLLDFSQRPLMAVVKDNALGCGSIEISKVALSAGASWLGVARYCEARVLRDAGINSPILVLGTVTPNEVDQAIKNQITLTLYSFETADLYATRAKVIGKPVLAHLKIDTGFGRLGIYPNDAIKLMKYTKQLDRIIVDGIYSHFTMAATVGHSHTTLQIKRFIEVLNALKEIDLLPKWIHLANSAAIYYEKDSYFNMVRAGSAIMGLSFTNNLPYPSTMQRVFSWKTRLASCKVVPRGSSISYGQLYRCEEDEIVGVIPIGYGDGYRRGYRNYVLIDGKRVPVVGVECMDMTMIKLPCKYPMGTEVVLIGTQGDESIYVEDICKTWGTIVDDVTTNINERVPRVYINR